MADTYKWAKQFVKEGVEIFDDRSVKILRAMQRKYTDFHTFFTKLVLLYKGQKMTKEQEKAGETISLIEEVNNQINKILDIRETPKKETVDELAKLVNKLDSNIDFFSKNLPNLSKAMQKRIIQIEEKTDIKLENLNRASKLIKGKLRTVGRAKKKPGVIREAIGKAATTMGGELLKATLGPLAEVATQAFGLYRKHKERKIIQSEKALAGGLSLESEKTPEAQKEFYYNLFGSGKARVPETLKERTQFLNLEKPLLQKTNQGATLERVGVGGGLVDLKHSLYVFFNRDAFKAKWTSELLNNLKIIAEKKDNIRVVGSNVGLGEKILGVLKKGLLAMGPAIAVGLAAKAGWEVGKLINKIKIGDKNIGEHVQSFAEKHIFHKVNVEKQALNEIDKQMFLETERIKKKNPKISKEELSKRIDLERKVLLSKNKVEIHRLQREEGLSLEEAYNKAEGIVPKKEKPSPIKKEIEEEGLAGGTPVLRNLNDTVDKLTRFLRESEKGKRVDIPVTNIGDPFLEALSNGSLEVD